MSRTRLRGALLLPLSLIPAVAAYFVLTVWLPHDIARYRDYVRAEPCAAGTSAREHEDCLREATFTVEGTKIKDGGRSSVYEATLSGAPFWNGVLSFGDATPLLSRLEPGDRVTGTVWRGDVMSLSRHGVRQSSADEPRDEPQMIAALGTWAGLLSALGLATGSAHLAGARTFPWRGFGKPLLITVSIACPVVGLLSVWWGLPWWITPALLVPLLTYTAWELHRYPQRRPRPTAPGPPDG